MSLKENVDFVKNELNSEEKFLESFVKVERFYKKNKTLIIAAIIIVVVAIIGFSVKSYIDKENKVKANIAFNKFLNDVNNQEALKTLEETNKKLYDMAIYLKAKKNGQTADVNVLFFNSLSKYQKALKEQSIEKLNNVSMDPNFLLKEFAIFNKALIEAKDGKYEDAKITLKLIQKESKAYELVKILNHYLLTK
ncbi:tetratricopeptide repeat protein [Malaciobacter marinus]|jgi:predicted negative regulator of RcsB-dependent stress response|uniref:tetratricopeptide repeat protein n=1 Tax=Malaciobacter marinus TaxID=505249 RepID=UPI0009A598BD|nr:tetratricopeptide repeat protein [Malaciobacter marinus]SKB64330.1 Tetratricopeptide repeat-containing protein [Malaciobacter marinus]